MPGVAGGRLFESDLDDVDLRHFHIPVGTDVFKDEAKVGCCRGRERGGGDRFGIYIGLAATNEGEGECLDLWGEADVIAEEDLDGDPSDGAAADIGDVAIDIGGLAAGETGGLAHLLIRKRERGGVGVERQRLIERLLAMTAGEEDECCEQEQSDATGDEQRGEVAIFFFACGVGIAERWGDWTGAIGVRELAHTRRFYTAAFFGASQRMERKPHPLKVSFIDSKVG